ncbi:protein TIC 22 [Populus alba x Populus x berolinensis]|uniref:Protein TIC 22, chloroplastic n=1 Tax=Populus alba x Populus x berolinensis TaxID=444605 RepID=A0AAD6LR09_9ROSI|nr:protein TIC 22 [Populus alba x Populus x berolinensis]
MEPSKPSNPLLSLSTVIHQHCFRLGAEFSARVSDTTRFLAGNFPPPSRLRLAPSPPFASVSQPKQTANTANLSSEHVAKALAGTAVYTVSNSDNEFVLISDPNGAKSIGLLCFRQEDAEAFLAQVRLRRRELRSQAKVVPITLDQVYMLKVEGIAFRFLPDPVQIKNALELKAAGVRSGFDGVPVFQESTRRINFQMSFGNIVPKHCFLMKSVSAVGPTDCEEEKQEILPGIFSKGRYRKRTVKGFKSIKGSESFSTYYGMILFYHMFFFL